MLAISLFYGVIAYQALDKALNQITFLNFMQSLKTIYET
jgi:hypothetical protein